MENSTGIPQKKNLNRELPYDPAVPLVGIDPKAVETRAQTDMGPTTFTTASCNSQVVEAA